MHFFYVLCIQPTEHMTNHQNVALVKDVVTGMQVNRFDDHGDDDPHGHSLRYGAFVPRHLFMPWASVTLMLCPPASQTRARGISGGTQRQHHTRQTF